MLSLALLAAAASGPVPGSLKTFADWAVGCDNVRVCKAIALQPEENFDRLAMVVMRDAQPASRPEIVISRPPFAENQPDLRPVSLSVDLVKLRVRFVMDNGRVRIQPDDVSAFLDALRPTKNMALLDARGAEIGHVSLAGLSAALLFMDDQQKRIGTVTALIRKGPNPASAVPAPPALPMIVSSPVPKAPPRLLTGADQARLLKPFACEHKDAGDFSPSHIRLDSKTTLALLPIPCGNGAYNYVALALQIDERGRVTPALFDSPPTYGEDPATNEVIGSAWDAEKRTLTSYSKDRGLGDCGLQTEYVWDGTRFRLILQEEMRECRGSVEFITLWRATVVRR